MGSRLGFSKLGEPLNDPHPTHSHISNPITGRHCYNSGASLTASLCAGLILWQITLINTFEFDEHTAIEVASSDYEACVFNEKGRQNAVPSQF